MKTIKFIALGLAAALILWGGGFGLFAWSSLSAQPQKPQENTDAIIVFTGGNGRVYEGLSLFSSKRSKQLFISGIFESVTMKDILSQWDGKKALPSCCITLGYKARSTVQNAAEVKEWLEGKPYKTLRLVTGNYHMHRAAMELRSALPGTKIYLHPVEQADLIENQELLRNLLISEYHKTIYRWFMLSFSGEGSS